MYPVYNGMESYPQLAPHQRNYIPYPYYYNPPWEVDPPHVKMDPANSPATPKPWPCSLNPTECHGCCNLSHPSCYYSFRAPHPYHPPHLPLYYYAYPPHHEAYPQYFVPPHFPVEQAQCEYDKNMARNHCCAYPNHTCNDKAGGQVKIEEESPETGRRDSDSHDLVKLQNHPHPIIWMPPGYVKDRETAKPSDTDSKIWNGWIPLDLNGIRSLNKGEDEKRIKDQQIEDKKPQLQWPIIWLPGYDKPEEVEKEDIKDINASPNVAENIPSKFKIIPVKLLENENSGEKPVVAEDTTVNGPSSAVADKEIKTKGKVAEKESTPRNAAIEKETKVKDIQVKQVEENGEKKSENTAKKPSFPAKTSKLPPVCLRVDPLPKKNNGNGTSRSPSPPAAKDRGHQNSTGQEPAVDKAIDGWSENKERKTINVEKPTQIINARKAPSKTKEIKVVNVEEKPSQTSDARVLPKQKDMQVVQVEEQMKPLQTGTGNDKQLQSIEAVTQVEKDVVRSEDRAQCHVRDPTNLSEKVSATPVTNRVESGEGEHETMEGGNEAPVSKMEDKKKEMGKTLSDMEAAILIQSAYRGFEVRKWEPLKKLSQIARVRKQVDDIREQLNDLESSAKLQDEKQRVMINETIMSLLLQLDTIQGLHPSIRESRKSVVRELVGLQEKHDSFSTQKAIEELPIEKACRDDETIQEDGSVLRESSPNRAEFVEPLIDDGDVASYASHLSEAVQTMASNEEQQLETKQNEVLELPAADAKSEEEEIRDHLTSVESKASSISAEELMEVHTMNDGKHSSEEEHVESSPSVNVEPASRAEESTRDEVKHSAVNDKLVESMQIDATGDSTEENPSEATLIGTQEKAASTLESVKDAQAEVLLESQTENEELSMASGSPKTCDECVDSVSEGDLPETNNASQIEVDQVESASIGKEHNVERSAEPPSVIPELSSPAVQGAAEYDPVKEEGSGEDEERQLHFSRSNIDAMTKVVTPKLTNEENGVDVSGASIMSDADAMLVMVGEPISEKMGEQNCQRRILEDFGIESSKETRVDTSSDICEAATHPQAAELIDQTPDAESTVEVQSSSDVCEVTVLPLEVEAKSHPPYVTETLDAEVVSGIESSLSSTILESDTKQALNIANNSVPVGCGIGPVPSSEVELRKENRDLAGENERLKEMLEKLLEAGKQQLTVISDLNGRVRDLEKKLAKKGKMKIRRQKAVESSCMRQTVNMVNQRAHAASIA